MDLHPLVIHFPIAFLFTYSIFEIISIRRLQEKQYWFYIKAILVSLGTLGAIASHITGLLSPNLVKGEPLVDMHLYFSIATIIIFGLISIPYLFAWFGRERDIIWASKLLFKRSVMLPLAVIGLAAIVITGGLGGAIVYGTDFDPFMVPIFKLLNVY